VSFCKIERRIVERKGTLDMQSGKLDVPETGEQVTRPCGSPLFGDVERKLGVCQSCLKGFIHPENEPTELGLDQIIEAQAAAGVS